MSQKTQPNSILGKQSSISRMDFLMDSFKSRSLNHPTDRWPRELNSIIKRIFQFARSKAPIPVLQIESGKNVGFPLSILLLTQQK